ncbi:WD40 repeat domain-containing protein [Bacillus paralicheniformis]|uniref:WD40 repeat domain-containing protein n=1 Tax=Bacillus paralicheniformis TaxID=1648923 RepID=UPI002283008F|nr:WD40 repeat domain-containing protein [Bacillus paralicheniformis]MCY8148862.1 WD40 repeat domain-containing protein [Bacillus paralicheniformis]MCY9419584.1 WD40 repeat domain-containing protein [Bacillus paralicheniformis]MEC0579597.1 WD40 repeat domain-containing protein [Bacillus paralicheniformis]
MMKNKPFIIWAGVLLFLAIIVSSYNVGKRSETIIIPSGEDNHVDDQKTRPFQVNTIYRLPKAGQLLGWSSPDSVVGFFKGDGTSERTARSLQRLSSPYEKAEIVKGIESNMSNLKMSPDGKRIAGVNLGLSKASIQLLSTANGKKTEIASIPASNEVYVQDVSWSNNSRYVCYLVLDAGQGNQTSLRVYDTDSGTLKTYTLKDFAEKNSLTAINISDNGRDFLLTVLQRSDEYGIRIGTIDGNRITIQDKRLDSRGGSVWLNNDQFVFLDTGETLYEYDRRNGELSALLEKVTVFKFSNDLKKIAYSLKDEDNIYAGKLQGKNILYEEPIYHGTIPSEIYWSPDGNSLLVSAQYQYPSMESASARFLEEQAYIITFK